MDKLYILLLCLFYLSFFSFNNTTFIISYIICSWVYIKYLEYFTLTQPFPCCSKTVIESFSLNES